MKEWNGCPSCEDCEDREPYRKCSDHCIAFRQWKDKEDKIKEKWQREAWLDTVVRRRQ